MAGVYALKHDCPYGMLGLRVVLADMYPENVGAPPLICAGTYSGRYHLVVNSIEYNYLILAQDASVDKFYLLLESHFVPVQPLEDIDTLLMQLPGAPIW